MEFISSLEIRKSPSTCLKFKEIFSKQNMKDELSTMEHQRKVEWVNKERHPIFSHSSIIHLHSIRAKNRDKDRLKVMTNLDSISKSRYITLLNKVRLVKAMVLPADIYGCECWTVKKAGH